MKNDTMPSLMTSLLDETFFKSHIQVFDDMKM